MKSKPKFATSSVVEKRQSWQNILARWVRRSVAATLIGAATFFTIDVYAATDYIVGPGGYATLEALRSDTGITWTNGDTITLSGDDSSLTDGFDFGGASVTFKGSGRISPADTGFNFAKSASEVIVASSGGALVFDGFENTGTNGSFGGAFFVDKNGTFSAVDGDVTFQNNKDRQTTADYSNAIYFENTGNTNTVVFNATAGNTLAFYSTVKSSAANTGLTININPDVADTGTVLFSGTGTTDSQNFNLYGNTTVSNGTMKLANNAKYGNSGGYNSNTFTLGSSATLATSGSYNSLYAKTINLQNGSTLNFDMTGVTTSGVRLSMPQDAALNLLGTINVNVDNIGALGSGTYLLIEKSLYNFTNLTRNETANGVAIATWNANLPNARYGSVDINDTTTGKLNLILTNQDASRTATWTNASGNGEWNEISNNWNLSGTGGDAWNVFKNGDMAAFGDTGGEVSIQASGVGIGQSTSSNDSYSGITIAGGDWTFTGGEIRNLAGGNYSPSIRFTGDGSVMFDTRTVNQRIAVNWNSYTNVAVGALAGNTVTFEGFRTGYIGGAIFTNSGNLALSGPGSLVFTDNAVNGAAAGAIASQYGNVTISSGASTFERNSASGNGGAAYAGANFSIENGTNTFYKNISYSSGGALYGNALVSITGGVNSFTDNTATGSGGAIHSGGNVSITGGTNTFTDNTASTGYGGAISTGGNITLIVDDGSMEFRGNTDSNGANALYMSGNTLTLAAKNGKSILFYDPIETLDSGTRTITINSDPGDTGTVLFDTYRSNVYGSTTVSYGTMALTGGAIYGAAANNPSFTLESGATLKADAKGDNNVSATNITVANGASFLFDMTGAAVPTYTNLTLAGNSTTFDGKINVNALTDSANNNGIYTVLTSTGANFATLLDDKKVDGAAEVFGVNDRYANKYYITDTIGSLKLKVTPEDVKRTATWAGSPTMNWSEARTDANWTLSQTEGTTTEKVFKNGDDVVFGDTGVGTINVTAGMTIGDMTVSNTTGTYTFNGQGIGKAGVASVLTKTGAGTLTFNQANAFTSANLSDGRINVNVAGALGSGTVTIDDATLGLSVSLANDIGIDTGGATIDNAVAVTMSGKFDGSGDITKTGGGDLTLTNTANDIRGEIIVSAGKLIGGTAALSDAYITNNAAVEITGAGTYSGVMSGSGSLTKSGTGDLTLSNATGNTYGGDTTISAGKLIVYEGTLGTAGDYAGNIVNNGALEFNQAVNQTLSGDISGTGSLTKMGTGTLTLTGENSYAGQTSINAGKITGDTDSLGSTSKIWGLAGATVEFNQTTNGTFGKVIDGDVAFVKSGGGELTLSGENTYTGGTTVSAGTLIGTTNSLQGNIVNNANLRFEQNSDGTYSDNLTGTGAFVKMGAGKVTLSEDVTQGSVTLNAGALTLAAGKTLTVNSFLGGALTTLDVTGNTITGNATFGQGMNLVADVIDTLTPSLTIGGTMTVGTQPTHTFNVNAVYTGTLAAGTYTLIDQTAGTFDFTGRYVGKVNGEDAGLNGANIRYGGTTFNSATAGQLNLVVTAADLARTATWNSAATGGTWNEVLENWTLSQTEGATTAKVFKNGDHVVFGDTGAGTVNIDNGSYDPIAVRNMTVNNTASNDYTFTGDGISSTAQLLKYGSGTVTVNMANTFNDGTNIHEGRVNVGVDGALGTKRVYFMTNTGSTLGLADGITLANDLNMGVAGNVAVDGSAAAEISGVISNSGLFTKTGNGSLTLSGANTNSGGILVSAGTLIGNTGSLKGAITNNANLEFNQGADGAYAGTLTGSGTFTKSGDGVLTFSDSATQAAFNLNAGSLKLETGKNLTGNFAAASGTTLKVVNSTITGNSSLAADSRIEAALDGTNTALTLTGAVTVVDTFNLAVTFGTLANGTYTVIDAGSFSFTDKYVGTINGEEGKWNGTNIRYGGADFDTTTAGKLNVIVADVDGVRTATWNSASAGGTWSETAENWTLSGGSSYKVFKNGDAVEFGDQGAGSVAVLGGTSGLSISTMTVNNTVGNDYTFTGDAITSTGAFVKNNTGTVTFDGANNFASASLNGGTTMLNDSGSLGSGIVTMNGGTMGLANNLTLANSIAMTGAGSVAVEGTDAASLSGNFSGTGAFTKTGSGKLTLANGAAFGGTVNVNDGTLALASGKAISVTEMNVAASKTLQVADTTTLVTTGNVNFADDSILALDMTDATNSGTILTLDVGGTLNFGTGSTVIDAINTTGLSGTYTVISAAGFDFAGKYVGKINGQAGGFVGANARYGGADYDHSQTGKLLLHVTDEDDNRQATWTGGADWNETSNNWDLDGSDLQVFMNGDSVVFGDTGVGAVNVNNGTLGAITVSTMNVTNTTGTYVFSGNAITADSFTKTGAGLVTFNMANNFASASLNGGRATLNDANGLGSGTVSINGGTLGLADGLTFANEVALVGNGNVAVDGTDSATMNGVISGDGSLTKSGAGELTLTGANAYSGGTTVSGGKLIGNTTSLQGDVTNNAELTFDQTSNDTFAGSVIGTGTLEKTGAGNLTLGNNVQQGSVVLDEGTLTVAAGKSVKTTGLFDVNDGTTLAVNVGASPAVDAGSFNIGTGATLSISGYTSAYPQTAFTLVKSGSNISGSFDTVTVGGQTIVPETPDIDVFLDVQVDQAAAGGKEIQIVTDLVWNKSANAHGTFNIASGETFTLSTDLSDNDKPGAGTYFAWDGKTLTKKGDGKLILNGDNDYSGPTNIESGILVAGSESALGNSAVQNDAALELVYDGDFGNDLSGNGSLTTKGNITITNANTGFAGATTVASDTLTLKNAQALGGSAIKNDSALVLEFNGDFDNGLSGAGSLATKGNITIDTANAGFSGATTIASGKLALQNASALGNSAIANNAALELDFNGNFSNDLSGTGSLTTKQDVVITRANAGFTGATTVASDTLTLQNAAAVGTSTVNVNNNELKLEFDGTYAGSITGTGTLTTDGDVVIGKANTGFNGTAVVEDGTLTLTDAKAVGSATIENKDELVLEFVGDFGNTMTGTGTMVTGTDVNMIGDQSGYTGTVDITEKTVTLGSKGGPTFVSGATYKIGNTGVLAGEGTIAQFIAQNGSIVAPGFSPGTITVTDGAIFETGSTYQVEVDAASTLSDKIVSNTNVVVEDGAILDVTVDGKMVFNTTKEYEIIETETGVDNTFSNVLNKTGYKFDQAIRDNNLYLLVTATMPEFGKLINGIGSPNAVRTAYGLDAVIEAGQEAAVEQLFNALANLADDPNVVAGAFAQLHGEMFATNAENAARMHRSFNERLVRMGRERDLSADCSPCGMVNESKRTLWGTFSGDTLDRARIGRFSGLDLNTYGVAIGVEQQLNRRWFLGAAFGYDNATAKYDAFGARDESDIFRASIYGGFKGKRWYGIGHVGYGKNWHDTSRNIGFGNFSSTSKAKYDDDMVSSGFELGRTYKIGRGRLTPSFGLDYVHVSAPGFMERGGNGTNLVVASDNYDSLRLPIGARWNRDFKGRRIVWTPEVRAYYVPELLDRMISVQTGFAGTTTRFAAESGDWGRHSGRFGVGMGAALTDRLSVRVDYDYEVWNHTDMHNVGGNVTYRW